MNPLFFGTSERQLFGTYDPSQIGGRRGVVVCHPWGREYLLAYPTVRHLARQLSQAGWHVLRFDYYGTGDSAGQFEDASQAQWLADIDCAVDELKDLAQLSHVTLIGMRYGAALAALAAARRRDIERLVLWDPVLDGGAFLAELGVPPRSAAGGSVDVAGVVLSDALRRDMQSISPLGFDPGLPQMLVLDTLGTPDVYQPLRTRLSAGPAAHTVAQVRDIAVWREEWGRGGVGMAVTAINAIVAWMT